MIGGLYILNHKGDTIIYRILQPGLPTGVVNLFRVNIVNSRAPSHFPLNRFDKYHFMHILLANGVWMVAVATSNINCVMIFEYLIHIKRIIKSYIGTISEDRIKAKIPLLLELLEETMDYGYPQITDISSLKTFITQKSIKNANKLVDAIELTNQLTGQITWRKPGIKYRRNEIFIDVVEKINLLMSAQGKILSTSVNGNLLVRTFLSGMPECKLGISDKFLVERQTDARFGNHNPKVTKTLDDCVFHQKYPYFNVTQLSNPASLDLINALFKTCVKLNKYESEKSITFIPPDGKFDLLKYRASNDVSLPFRVFPLFHDNGTSIEFNVSIKANYSDRLVGSRIEVSIPVPKTTNKTVLNMSKGRAKYRKGENSIAWRIRALQGQKDARLRAVIYLNSLDSAQKTALSKNWNEEKRPISLKFEVPFSSCGMKIRYLKVYEHKLNYNDSQVVKWVRYTANEGNYDFRI